MKRINYMAPINPLGYGVLGFNLLKALEEIDVEVTLFPIGQVGVDIPSDTNMNMLQKCVDRQKFYDVDAVSLRVYHQFSMAECVGKNLRTGFPIFELDDFNEIEQHHLKSLDHVFVSSKWAKNIVQEVVKHQSVSVAPLGVDTSIFRPNKNLSDCRFTSFVNMGKWEIRKGHDILVDVFNAAFEPEDKVRLMLLTENPFLNETQRNEWINMYKNSKLGDKIDILPRAKNQYFVSDIMNAADCGIFPSRAEGWNLEALEMMACDRPIIITNCTAHTEFCTSENSYLVDVPYKEPAFDGIWFDGEQGSWHNIDEAAFDQMVEYMRQVHKDKQENCELSNPSGLATAKKFSWIETAKAVRKIL